MTIQTQPTGRGVSGVPCIRLIAAAIVCAWMDAVGVMESTYNTRLHGEAYKKDAQEWVQGSDQYTHWMEILGLSPDLKPEGLLEEYGPALLSFLEWE